MRSVGNKTRTQKDRTAAMCTRLIMARGERIDELIAGHTAESFAKAHNISYLASRSTFEDAVKRRSQNG